MPRLALLGDSVFDNARYVAPGPSTAEHLRLLLSPHWEVDLLAVDGSSSVDIAEQLRGVHDEHAHLVLSCGGSDALRRIGILAEPVDNAMDALLMMADFVDSFRTTYRAAVAACLATGRPLSVCTVYHGHFRNDADRRAVGVALSAFNDAIVQTAVEYSLRVIDLRMACRAPGDFEASLRPSVAGGAKVADAIARALRIGGVSERRIEALIAA